MPSSNYIETFKSAIVRVYNASEVPVGAGFLVSEKHILTCAHVVTAALGIDQKTQEIPTGEVELDFPLEAPGQKVKATVVFWHPVNPTQINEDIAGLILKTSSPRGSTLPMVVTEDLWGHSFRIFGFPQNADDGIWVNGVLRDKQAKGWAQLDSLSAQNRAVEKGFSGAPVWDESLQGVVGMAVAAEKRREDVTAAFMIPTQVLTQSWSLLDCSNAVKDLEPKLSRTQVLTAQMLEQRLQVLEEDYKAVWNQQNYTSNAADRNSLRRQYEAIAQEMSQTEKELDELGHGRQ